MQTTSCIPELVSVLTEAGWVELSPTLSFKEMRFATDYLDGVLGPSDEDWYELSFFDGTDFVELKPTTLQFFYDLYGFGSSEETVDVLVSYLGEEEKQEYIRYSGADPADIQEFFQDMNESPAFIFQGTFSQLAKDDGSSLDVSWLSVQRTLNGICIDIDGAEFSDGKHPIDAETLRMILEAIPEELTAQYLMLTGNGIHLWYVFSSFIQTFSRNTIRRRKLKALVEGVYRIYELMLEGLDATVDIKCTTLNHPFRAPGSLTKDGDTVRCFCRAESVFKRSTLTVPALSRLVADSLGDQFLEKDVITEEEAVYRTREEIERNHQEWVSERMQQPATEKQLEFIRELEEQHLFKQEELAQVEGLSQLRAQNLISKALNRRAEGGKQVGKLNDYSDWKTKPHWLIAGETGGVYNTVLRSITRVKPGNRYNSLHMLAGVAYMMVKPEKTLASLTDDFMGLLNSPWGRAGKRLTERDIKNALLGYNPDNRQTANSIVKTLGFNPFSPAPRRNGRTLEEHLALVHAKRSSSTRARITAARQANPGANKTEIAQQLGLSWPTVSKYWEDTGPSRQDDSTSR